MFARFKPFPFYLLNFVLSPAGIIRRIVCCSTPGSTEPGGKMLKMDNELQLPCGHAPLSVAQQIQLNSRSNAVPSWQSVRTPRKVCPVSLLSRQAERKFANFWQAWQSRKPTQKAIQKAILPGPLCQLSSFANLLFLQAIQFCQICSSVKLSLFLYASKDRRASDEHRNRSDDHPCESRIRRESSLLKSSSCRTAKGIPGLVKYCTGSAPILDQE